MGTVWRAGTACWRVMRRSVVKHEPSATHETAAQSQLRRFEREAKPRALLQSKPFDSLFDFGGHRGRHLLLRDGVA